jgi:hypothetical protein
LIMESARLRFLDCSNTLMLLEFVRCPRAL